MSELRTRIEARKKQLEADLLNKKADAQGAAQDATRRVKAKLSELELLLKDGWHNISDSARTKLNDWLR